MENRSHEILLRFLIEVLFPLQSEQVDSVAILGRVEGLLGQELRVGTRGLALNCLLQEVAQAGPKLVRIHSYIDFVLLHRILLEDSLRKPRRAPGLTPLLEPSRPLLVAGEVDVLELGLLLVADLSRVVLDVVEPQGVEGLY